MNEIDVLISDLNELILALEHRLAKDIRKKSKDVIISTKKVRKASKSDHESIRPKIIPQSIYLFVTKELPDLITSPHNFPIVIRELKLFLHTLEQKKS